MKKLVNDVLFEVVWQVNNIYHYFILLITFR